MSLSFWQIYIFSLVMTLALRTLNKEKKGWNLFEQVLETVLICLDFRISSELVCFSTDGRFRAASLQMGFLSSRFYKCQLVISKHQTKFLNQVRNAVDRFCLKLWLHLVHKHRLATVGKWEESWADIVPLLLWFHVDPEALFHVFFMVVMKS